MLVICYVCIVQVICYGSDADIAWNRNSLTEQLKKMSSVKPPADMIHLRMDFIPSTDVTSPTVRDLIGSLKKIRDTLETLKVSFPVLEQRHIVRVRRYSLGVRSSG